MDPQLLTTGTSLKGLLKHKKGALSGPLEKNSWLKFQGSGSVRLVVLFHRLLEGYMEIIEMLHQGGAVPQVQRCN